MAVDGETASGSRKHSAGRGRVVFDIVWANIVRHFGHTVIGSLQTPATAESKTRRSWVSAADVEENVVVGGEVKRGTGRRCRRVHRRFRCRHVGY